MSGVVSVDLVQPTRSAQAGRARSPSPPPLTVFAGTRDLIHPDSGRLAGRADASGLAVDP
ncbi:hypothetical protein [Streptomyces sp. R35]|uniref:Uncharacterized protein n=1 Tax=Streptomyces sp. R35 TaxID=3238630 RepID=A0AB39SPM9_9ACTN